MSLCNNQELKRLLASNLKANFRWLMICYQHKLYNFVRHMLQYPEDADDLVQEVFIKAYKSLSSFSSAKWEELELQPWLFKVARNHCLNHVTRMERRQLKQVSLDQSMERGSLEQMAQRHHSSPEREMENKETLEELHNYIRQLSEPLRASVVLHYIIGLSYQEIAVILNQPENTVKSNGRRGLKILQEMMKEEVK